MKTIFYSLLTMMLFTAATCRKSDPGTALEKRLIGVWKYTGKTGGYAGKYQKADPANLVTLQFQNGFNYLKRINDQVSEQGSYELYKIKSIYSGKEDNAIRFNSAIDRPNINSIISMRNDTLTIADNVYDGFTMEYIRVK